MKARANHSRLRAMALGLGVAVEIFVGPTPSLARPTQLDPVKVQALALQIEQAIATLGPSAPEAAEAAAIRAVIAASGDTSEEAQAAIHVARASVGLTRSARLALAYMSSWFENRLVLGSRDGGFGGGPSIGAPPNAISFGGSNYRSQ